MIDDGRPPLANGSPDLLHLIVEIKGYRREDAKVKKETMETRWIPGVNNDGSHGRWAFAEFGDQYAIQSDFEDRIEAEVNKLIDSVAASAGKV